MKLTTRFFLSACLLPYLALQPIGAAQSPHPGLAPEILTPLPSLAPRINGPHVCGGRPNHPFFYRIPTTGQRPISFSAQGLPAGLAVDSATGFITGVTTQAGTFSVSLQAANAVGKDHSQLKLVIGDKIALTPPLGFNTWNHFNGGINDKIIRETVDAMIRSGLADHGWSYINLDDCWMRRPIGANRNPGDIEPALDPSTGALLPNLWRFPDMKKLANYVHAQGLKFGIYSSPGFRTCAWSTGSLGHEDADAHEFAAWGVDYLKYDWCSYGYTANYLRSQDSVRYLEPEEAQELDTASRTLYSLIQAQHEEKAGDSEGQIRHLNDKITALLKKVPRDVTKALILKYQKEPYSVMGRSLAKVNRDIVYSFCQYGDGNSWEWADSLGANSWRTTGDIQDKWESVYRIGFEKQAGLEKFAWPAHWNDPDMLEVGNGGLSPDEETSHMTLWCMLSAPLLIGCDLTKMSDFTKSLFTNDEVLAIDQDELGKQGYVAVKEGDHQTWIKPLSDGAIAVAMFNLGTKTDHLTVRWAQLGLTGSQRLRDLWRQRNLGVFAEDFSTDIASHGVMLLRVSPEQVHQSP